MPATCSTRGVLKASQNRVRTSTALQGSAMWENVIGIVNEERGANAGVEALINAPQHGGGARKAALARRTAAAEAVLATGGFDSAVTDYDSLLALAKTQGAVGGSNRGACKTCGQLGHLTKQCRNTFSKYYTDAEAAAAAAAAAGGGAPGGAPGGPPLGTLVASDSGLSSDSSSDSSEDERRRKKEKKRKREKHERKEKKDRREKKERREKRRRKEKRAEKEKKEKRSRRSKSPASSGSHSD
jgi:hypothetical protein